MKKRTFPYVLLITFVFSGIMVTIDADYATMWGWVNGYFTCNLIWALDDYYLGEGKTKK